MEIRVRNVNEAVSEALWKLKVSGVKEESRNGPVIVFPEPVTTIYEKPQERVLFWGERDCNPTFHLMESLWMMAGRRDVKFVEYYNSGMKNFSDNGLHFNAAYGHRWRHKFGVDQIVEIIKLLREDPKTRRAVMQIWDPADLLKVGSKDLACNLEVLFDTRYEQLNMTVLNRSNDMIWGAYGANAVHFSFMMEFIASAIGLPVGTYRQFSNNLHMYTELYDFGKHLENPPDHYEYDHYKTGVKPYPIMTGDNWESWLKECEEFCDNPYSKTNYEHSFFLDVATPMAVAYKMRKDKLDSGKKYANQIVADDWRIAVIEWIDRREAAKTQKGL